MVYDDNGVLYERIVGFLNHGVKSDDWKQRERGKVFEGFLKEWKGTDYFQEAVINLASEMAKICKS